MFPNYQETQGYHEHIQAMQARTPRHAEFFLPNLKTWVEVNIYPSMDGGLAIYFRDITERKRAEESLCESEQKFRTVIETAGESIGIASPNGPFYYVN